MIDNVNRRHPARTCPLSANHLRPVKMSNLTLTGPKMSPSTHHLIHVPRTSSPVRGKRLLPVKLQNRTNEKGSDRSLKTMMKRKIEKKDLPRNRGRRKTPLFTQIPVPKTNRRRILTRWSRNFARTRRWPPLLQKSPTLRLQTVTTPTTLNMHTLEVIILLINILYHLLDPSSIRIEISHNSFLATIFRFISPLLQKISL